MQVHNFHLLFMLKLDEEVVRNARHIGDKDVKAFLNNVQLEERFMKQAPPYKKNKRPGAVRTT